METKTVIIWTFAAFLAFIEISTASKESKLDQDDSGVKSVKRRSNPMEDITDSYEFSNEDLDELVKRGSLFRFGKRGALFRFGKRNDDDKRGSLFRFGKRMDGYYVSPYASSENFPEKDDKRGSLFRFGKRSSLFRFGRSVDNEKPHTPFRFGREEEDEI
ncbi:uncharacterized protein LOC125646253 [Ostrea edulis]|uniref:uncharacterized protein LOC125646253 n=1 Tax=Ostrea edulis TaxID=37623 RepID=UPI0024AFB5C7|nr:uncharacterized protein LOC125646253 [Ostrea edulis]